MPELPEVETVRRGLERTVRGYTIIDCAVANPKVLRGQSPETLRERIVGSRIEQIERRGKYLAIRLLTPNRSPEPLSVILHLKMRGQIAVEAGNSEPAKYHCVTLAVARTGDEPLAVRFYDAWTWGELRALYESEIADAVPSLGKMGPEPLDAAWTGEVLANALRGKRTAIKPTLLDQSVVAGVGNIYADEALYRSRINPLRPAGTLSVVETERLADAIKTVLTEAVGSGGTTSDNFFDTAGNAGNYVPQVYERGGKPCHSCATVLTKTRLAGRSSVYCEQCQPFAGVGASNTDIAAINTI